MLSIIITVSIVLGLLVAAELYARFALGLGNPPLWMADDEMEYLQQPSRRYVRGGNRIEYNAYSMRSRDFPRVKEDPSELRVLLVGDSIVNGGERSDQDELASALLERELADRLGRPVIVGNIAANSWGPPNWHAYLKRFGLFDADVVVIVVNSYDYADAPRFMPLGRKRPQTRPLIALQEILDKYIPRILRRWRWRLTDFEAPVTEEDVEWCLRAFRQTIDMARAENAKVIVAQHLKRAEIEGEREAGYGALRRVAREAGIEPIDLGPPFAAALERGARPYRDVIHPTAAGHRLIADALLEPIVDASRA